MAPDTPEQIALAWLPRIERMAAGIARRHFLSKEDTEDFVADLRCKILEEDYAVVRKFKGKDGAGLATYFHVVVANAFRDWQNRRWGKWRPTAEAKRLGEVAIQIEVLSRDGYSFDEVCRILRDNRKVALSEAALAAIAARLPHRSPRGIEGEETLEEMSGRDPDPEEQMLQRERCARGARLFAAFKQALAELPADEALLLRMRYEARFTIAQIARWLKIEERPLYRRMEAILRKLKKKLTEQGFDGHDLDDLFPGGE